MERERIYKGPNTVSKEAAERLGRENANTTREARCVEEAVGKLQEWHQRIEHEERVINEQLSLKRLSRRDREAVVSSTSYDLLFHKLRRITLHRIHDQRKNIIFIGYDPEIDGIETSRTFAGWGSV